MTGDSLTTARHLIDGRRHRAALRALAMADQNDPETAYLTGLARLGRRDASAADAALTRCLAARPDDPAALFHRGRARVSRGHLLAGIADLERVQRLAATFPGLNGALAYGWRRDTRYADALKLALAGLQADPADVDLLYEKGMILAHLGDGTRALACFERLLALDPEHAAGWFAAHAAVIGRDGIPPGQVSAALHRLYRASGCTAAAGKYWGFICAYLQLAGRQDEAERVWIEKVAEHPKRHPLPDAVTALADHIAPDMRVFGVSGDLLRHALGLAPVTGMVLEFGVRRGNSINQIAANLPTSQLVHGFDSFEGLPEGWVNGPRGLLSTGHSLPPVADNVRLHAGWFDDTLAPFLAGNEGPVRFVNIDSDIYSSARTVLSALIPRLQQGAILVFDEFIGNHSWREDEYRAFHEFIQETGIVWEVVALSLHTKQVAIRLL